MNSMYEEIVIPNIPSIDYDCQEPFYSHTQFNQKLPDSEFDEKQEMDIEFDWVLLKDNRLVLPVEHTRSRVGDPLAGNSISTSCTGLLIHKFPVDLFSVVVKKYNEIKGRPRKLKSLQSQFYFIVSGQDMNIDDLKEQIKVIEDI